MINKNDNDETYDQRYIRLYVKENHGN